jgi:putative phosphotransacetylase
MAIPQDELYKNVERIVRQVVEEMLQGQDSGRIPIGISARHMHITLEHLEVLFGPGARLTKMKDLPQPGEFAANETVTIVGPNRRVFEKVRILGDMRKFSQLELSYTDGIFLGMKLPHRLSGNVKGSAPFTVVGPKGVLSLPEGAIRAMRHIHMNPQHAVQFGVKHGDMVKIRTSGEMAVTFERVMIRVAENLNLYMHIDTDEANAAGMTIDNSFGYLVKE